MPTVIQVNNLESITRDFVVASIRKKYPNTDLSAMSPVIDVIAAPMQEISRILLEYATGVEQRQLLANASEMTDADLDDIGVGNYAKERKIGSVSSGVVTFGFKSVSEASPTVIPEGVLLETRRGDQFITQVAVSYTYSEMLSKWNNNTLQFEVSVPASSVSLGVSNNVGPGEIVVVKTNFTPYEVSVTNHIAFSGGQDTESNTAYHQRILKSISSRTLETEPGYQEDIKENFADVTDVKVVGFGNPLMTRDLLTSAVIGGVTFNDFHVGGMTDIYIRGYTTGFETTSVVALVPRFKLTDPATGVVFTKAFNERTQSDLPGGVATYSTENETVGGVTLSRAIVSLSQDASWVLGDTITIMYTLDGNPKTESFLTGSAEIQVLSPYISVSSLKNLRTGEFYALESSGPGKTYNIRYNKVEDKGTSFEKAYLTPVASNIQNGDEIEITYAYNQTINDITDHYNKLENRVVTRNILFKMASPKYLFIELKIKPTSLGLADANFTVAINTSVANFINALNMGDKIDESDIVSHLYQDPATKMMIDYIDRLPTFYATSDPAAVLEQNRRDGATASVGEIEYPIVKYVGVVIL